MSRHEQIMKRHLPLSSSKVKVATLNPSITVQPYRKEAGMLSSYTSAKFLWSAVRRLVDNSFKVRKRIKKIL
uniref:Uncharacterized protein n=1 Tax=Rhizophora mucronata TaxID=61149 RepID=A0A2P2M499_RHIMU